MEALKANIEHSHEIDIEIQKKIQRGKRMQNPMFTGKNPERTLSILNEEINRPGQGASKRQSESLVVRKRGKQKMNLAVDHIDIVALGEGDPTSIMKRMKNIED